MEKDTADNTVVAIFQSEQENLEARESSSLIAQSTMISDIKMWSMDDPNLYTVHTNVYSNGELTDSYETRFGFRSVQFTTDGFFLNGNKVILDGVNAHQDQAGWCDAVPDGAFYRDVQMVKDAGFNFIRGSHYPHDTAYADACDEIGIALWSEGGQWSIGGYKSNDNDYGNHTNWLHSAYPESEEYVENFEQSCMYQMETMVRMNRNHPSIVVWSMGNEAFFTSSNTVEKSKALVNKMRNRCHELDPTRKAGMGGTQRNGYNNIAVCDVAGGNGDGAKAKYTNYELPHLVSEYASTRATRNNAQTPLKFNQIESSVGSTITVNGKQITQYTKYEKEGYVHENTGNVICLPTGSSGMSVWGMFDHGSIASKNMRMHGLVDYHRLPKKVWYTYREVNTGVPREDSVEDTATKISIEANFTKEGQTTIPNDGSDDVQIIVTLRNDNDEWVAKKYQDDAGEWYSEPTGMILEVVDGPGVFPTGKTYVMKDDVAFMDGKGAISFRSYYPGTTTIRATATQLPDLDPVTIQIVTEDVTGQEAAEEPSDFMGEVYDMGSRSAISEPSVYGKEDAAYNRQTGLTTSSKEGHTPLMAVDGDDTTYWEPEDSDEEPAWIIGLENTYDVYKMKVDFGGEKYPFMIETKGMFDTEWSYLTSYTTEEELENRPMEDLVEGRTVNSLRISFPNIAEGISPRLYSCNVYGVEHKEIPYQMTSVYVSDLTPSRVVTKGDTFIKDRTRENKPITLDGVVYEKGLATHADSELVYDLNGKYTRFQATLGIDDETTRENGSAYFKVYGTYYDELLGKEVEAELYNELVAGEDTKKVDISVDQVIQLRLVTDKNGATTCDHTDWANAKLLGALRDISLDDKSLYSNIPVQDVLNYASGELTTDAAAAFGYDMDTADGNASNDISSVDALLLMKAGSGNQKKVSTVVSSNITAPKAGEAFEINVKCRSKTSESVACNARLSIYESTGALLDTVENTIELSKGESGYVDIEYDVPENKDGCYAVLIVVDNYGCALSEQLIYEGTPYIYVPDEAEENALAVARDYYELSLAMQATMTLSDNISLPSSGSSGSDITWISSDESIVSSGGVVTQSDSEDQEATLTATIQKGASQKQYTITCTILKKATTTE
ncbi:MAG: NPCBM/NEW2 domain-containing protein [Lachnospiraceae bacterium]